MNPFCAIGGYQPEDSSSIEIGELYYYSMGDNPYAYIYRVVAQNDQFVVIHYQTRGMWCGYVNQGSTSRFVKLEDFKKKAVRKV